MNKKTKIIIATAAFALIFAGAGVYMATENNWFSPPIAEPMPPENSASMAASRAAASSRATLKEKNDKYVVLPLPLPPIKDKTASSRPIEDEAVVTENPGGTTNTEITRPDFSKPEPPPPPKMDESQASDPTKEPEYTEEQLKPNEKPANPDKPSGGGTGGGTGDKPSAPDKPTGGETNNKGQIYVPGFGWTDIGNGNTVEVAENAGTGEVIGY